MYQMLIKCKPPSLCHCHPKQKFLEGFLYALLFQNTRLSSLPPNPPFCQPICDPGAACVYLLQRVGPHPLQATWIRADRPGSHWPFRPLISALSSAVTNSSVKWDRNTNVTMQLWWLNELDFEKCSDANKCTSPPILSILYFAECIRHCTKRFPARTCVHKGRDLSILFIALSPSSRTMPGDSGCSINTYYILDKLMKVNYIVTFRSETQKPLTQLAKPVKTSIISYH